MRLIDKIKRFSKIKFRFDFPKPKKILQYDELESNVLKNIIGHDFNIMPRHKTEIYFWIFIKQIIFFDLSFLTYFKNYIKFTSTKIVINFIDNDLFFYTLKHKIDGVQFIVIQNGIRPPNSIIFKNKKNRVFKDLKCDHFFAFNKYIIEKFKKNLQSNFYILGHYRNNMVKINKTKYKNSYLFISRKEISLKLLKLIALYFIDSNQKLNILLKSNNHLGQINEIKFYKNFFKSNCIFLKHTSFEEKYKTLDKFENIIFTNSTLGYEAISRKKKIAIFPTNKVFFDKNIFGWPKKNQKENDFFKAKKLDYSEVKRVLDNVYNCKQSDWEKKYYKNIKDLMYFDKKNLRFKKFIDEILKSMESD
jgi:hypothetical protein